MNRWRVSLLFGRIVFITGHTACEHAIGLHLALMSRRLSPSCVRSSTFIIGHSLRRFTYGTLLAAAMHSFGCNEPVPQVAAAPSQSRTDQLRGHYPDLASGRFAVLADFEDDAQFELFHMQGPAAAADDAGPSPDGVRETGGRCLRVHFSSEDCRLVANNASARAWLLKRDWRPYTLLVMSVFSPADGVRLTVELRGGQAERAAHTAAHWELRNGWNVLRFDLGEAGQYVPLDEISEIGWSVAGAAGPLQVRIDDVLLADNRTDMFGAPDGPEGTLYVQHEGRRLNVGAARRFELGFANGQVVRWYALDRDPARLYDLVGRGNTLGPMPVRLSPGGEWANEADWRWLLAGEADGGAIATHQRLVEVNPVRAIVECVWSRRDEAGGSGGAELARWLYVIYPTGQVYVTVDCGGGEASPEGEIGLAVSRLSADDAYTELHPPVRLSSIRDLAERSFACFTSPEAKDELGFMLYDSACGRQWRMARAEDDARLTAVAFDVDETCVARSWSALLALGPSGRCARATWAALDRTYGRSPQVEVVVGSFNTASPGDADGDGYNEREGAFTLLPVAGRVQLRLRAEHAPLMSPVFNVAAGPDWEAWVYVNHLIHQPIVRDAHGGVLFQLPQLIERDTLVEVYLRKKS
jgi:hypothetical protein